MKVARTFTIDYDLAQKLKRKPNQSRIVTKAVRRYLAKDEQFTTNDISTPILMQILLTRHDCPREIAALIQLLAHPTD